MEHKKRMTLLVVAAVLLVVAMIITALVVTRAIDRRLASAAEHEQVEEQIIGEEYELEELTEQDPQTPTVSAGTVEIIGLNDEAVALIGGDRNAVYDAFAKMSPTENQIEFEKTALVDFGQGTVMLNFHVPDRPDELVTLIYRMTDGSIETVIYEGQP